MVGIGETYVPAFALAAGLGEVVAGLVATVPLMAGGLLQLASPWAVQRLGSHRRWVVLCAGSQTLSLLLFVSLALLVNVPASLVFLAATWYWATGLATGPAWNAWVERLVPYSMRATFFAQRTWVSHACVLLGLVLGGVILRGATAWYQKTAQVFAILFAVAAGCRLVSTWMLARQSEPDDGRPSALLRASYSALLRDPASEGARRLVAYLLAVQVAVHVASPFFTPFMLVQLELSYLNYMILLSCGYLGKSLATPWAGRLAQQIGADRLLWIGGITIVPLSALWLVSNSFSFLIALQVLGGMAWAAYELAMLLLFFDAIPRQQRVTMLSLYNCGNSLAMVLGAVLGAAVIHWLDYGRAAYLAVFALSSAGRLLALLLIPRQVPHRFDAQPPAGLRTIAVRPVSGSMERPILPAIEAPVPMMVEETV
jgi:MFS family permease